MVDYSRRFGVRQVELGAVSGSYGWGVGDWRPARVSYSVQPYAQLSDVVI